MRFTADQALADGVVVTCPHCNGSIHRVPRRWIDRLVSNFIPARRYRCRAIYCCWEGNLRTTPPSAPFSGNAGQHEARDPTPSPRR